jgi:hypothetical protein
MTISIIAWGVKLGIHAAGVVPQVAGSQTPTGSSPTSYMDADGL